MAPAPLDGTLDTFLQSITALYNFAANVRSPSEANELVMEWLRRIEYNSKEWVILVGIVDEIFVSKVEDEGLTTPDTFTDPFYGPVVTQRVSHLGATMNAAYRIGLPGDGTSADSLQKINGADMAGWGGDMIQFYGEWLTNVAQYPDPGDYSTAMLFNQASPRFKMEDLLEDVDGFNIGLKLKNNPSLHIPDVLKQYYQPDDNHSGYKSRLRDFWNARFAAVDASHSATRLVHAMLFGLNNDGGRLEQTKLLYGAKKILQRAYGQENVPFVSPAGNATYCQSFLNEYKDLMNEEAATFP